MHLRQDAMGADETDMEPRALYAYYIVKTFSKFTTSKPVNNAVGYGEIDQDVGRGAG